VIKLATAKKPAARRPPPADEGLEAQLSRLSRQNAALKKEIAQLQAYRAMAYRDPLTGLWNRRYFEERLKEEISRTQRAGSGRKFSVLVVDINDFKEINDTHGHQAGDEFLQRVGGFLTTHLRTHDVACRTGGDEFMVLLPDLSAEDCGRILSRLRDQLQNTNSGFNIPVGLSLGTASWPESDASAARLIALADQAMYADKRRQKAAKAARAAAAPGTSGGASSSTSSSESLGRPAGAA
jgi:diguanylate cyclase (GGDEF)-like protein